MTDKNQAFQTLLEVTASARLTAKGLPAQLDIKPHWSGIGFVLFGRRFVAPMGEITEMLEIPHFTHLPGVQGWIKGLANVRGRLLPLTDLAAFLGGRLEAPRRNRRVLVIENGETYSGLMVDGVLGMQHFPVDSYVPEMLGVEYEAMVPYLQGSFREENGRDWIVFSPLAIIQDERFFQAAVA
ncbi:MAG TPA: chemotaxis protein CheW [Pseudomonadales bacterium]|nr:chemotaxis protein CheW [Pseudomonadales bacterium]